MAPAQRLPVPLKCGPEPKPPLQAIYVPLCLILPITFAQKGVNTGTSGRKGRWLVFCFEWGWVGKVELTVQLATFQALTFGLKMGPGPGLVFLPA